jgi:hypothetical protein
VGYHTVQAGDTWNSIAQTYNADVVILQAANRDILSVGNVLKIPLNSAAGAMLPVPSVTPNLTFTALPELSPTLTPQPSSLPTISSTTGAAPTSETSNPVGTPNPTRLPSTVERIDRALANGALPSETALIYKVYAAFGDERLPVEYRGDDSRPSGSLILQEVAQRFPALSKDAQSTLAPFFLRPNMPGSWLSLRAANAGLSPKQAKAVIGQDTRPDPTEMDFVATSDGKVRVWWQKIRPQDAMKAHSLVIEIQSNIWPALTGLRMREPSDETAKPDNGGSGALDVYLLGNTASRYLSFANGIMIPDIEGQCSGTAHVLVKADQVFLRNTLAHEMLHVFQEVYPPAIQDCIKEYHWLDEATGKWFEDYVYPKDNSEHQFAIDYLEETQVALEEGGVGGIREYGIYLFFFFLTKKFGDPSIMGKIY